MRGKIQLRRNSAERKGTQKMRSAAISAAILTLAAMPQTAVTASDTTRIGFGQGSAVDGQNRPLDAVSFSQRYADLGAYALTGEDDRVLITFDQGYENGYTARILDTLKEKNVQAVFFLTGDYAKREPELVKRMIAEGHVLGNHGMTHASIPELSENLTSSNIV